MLTSSIVFIALALAGPAQLELPTGWRYPSAGELGDPARGDSPDRYARVIADFNGDNVEDTALLLKSQSRSAEALWVLLSDKQGSHGWIKVSEIPWGPSQPDVPLAMGIDKVEPGVIAYACFDGAKECNFGPDSERPKLRLKSPSLMYFKMDSAASLLFWSNKHNRFMRVWLSD